MNEISLPFYAKLALTLVSLISIVAIIYFAQGILIPILIAMLFAILLRPIGAFLERKFRIPHVIATIMSVMLMICVVVGIVAFISFQVAEIASDWDTIKRNFMIHLGNIQDIVRQRFDLSEVEQKELVDDATKDSMGGTSIIGSTLISFTDTLINMMLIPIYTFLFLLYRTHFMKFLAKLFGSKNHDVMHDIMCKVKVSLQSYIMGLLIQMVTVSVLTTTGFMIIGLEYAILLGVITGILNLIPYIGILAAGVLSMVVSLTTSPDLSILLGVVIVIAVTQLIDNNLLVPMIVSSKVQINAFVSIVGIIIGGAVAGVAGMFLAIPTIAILKVIFDRIEPLRPWGYLMSDDLPKTYRWGKIKLPLYGYENASDTVNVDAETPVSIFTETTTKVE
ncbi:MAG TPA: AI-2E family transporter [Flavobacterium sp.]|jgi:predicted PurR-regulated permease PerM|nr:AI-2E family transporter [Flavobacterium sp.]